MKRIATPMIGGVITSAILNLLIYPVIYVIWRKRELPLNGRVESGPLISTNRKRSVTFKELGRFLIVALVAAALLAGGFATWNWWNSRSPSTAQVQVEPIATRTIGDLIVSIYG